MRKHLFWIMFAFPSFLQAQNLTIDSLKNVYEVVPDSSKGEVLQNLAIAYFDVDPEQSLLYAKRLDSIGHYLSDSVALIDAKLIEAQYLWRKGNFPGSMQIAINCLQTIGTRKGFEAQKAQAYLTSAIVHLYQVNPQEAINNFKTSLRINLSIGNKKAAYSALNNLGVVFMDRAISEKKEFYYDSALFYFTRVATNPENPNMNTRLLAYGNMAGIYELQNKIDKALSVFRQAIFLERKNASLPFRAMMYGTLGNIYSKLNKNDSALLYYNIGLKAAKDIQSTYDQFEYYKALAVFYEKREDYRKALDYAKQQAIAKDTIYNTEKSQVIAELETKYETEKKEQTIKDLEQENAIKDLQASQDKQLRYGLIILAILLCTVAILFYSRFKFKQRTSELLDLKNKELEQLNSFKDRLFAVVSHDLKSPLSAFHTLTSSLSANMDRISKEDLIPYVEELSQSSKDVYAMLNNLLEWAITQTGHMPFNPKLVDSYALVEDVKDQLSATARMNDISILNEVPSNYSVFADPGMFQIVIRNLIANAVKFSPPQSTITVSADEKNNSKVFFVIDEGIGIDSNDLEKVFQLNAHSRINNSVNKGTGIGLMLCKELVEKHKGKIWVESKVNSGSTFYFSLPNATL